MEKKCVWNQYSKTQIEEIHDFAKSYCDFLDNGKTERECVDQIVNRIEKDGYQELESLIKDSGLIVYEGCSHYAYLEMLPQVIKVVKIFLES